MSNLVFITDIIVTFGWRIAKPKALSSFVNCKDRLGSHRAGDLA